MDHKEMAWTCSLLSKRPWSLTTSAHLRWDIWRSWTCRLRPFSNITYVHHCCHSFFSIVFLPLPFSLVFSPPSLFPPHQSLVESWRVMWQAVSKHCLFPWFRWARDCGMHDILICCFYDATNRWTVEEYLDCVASFPGPHPALDDRWKSHER